ncbi:branched-chain amino acid ABC transporter permease [Homoserinimonas sp. OAct 916]|uniref:branched-chain amino acid ABC transporter permease n=1 Tax=Homoserinimonas sp. OAct 916 TaxID=2211450 RepID=UPI000DBE0EAB|nr:branched-chain amino acid ABC transporter permease [Homoserinimonas sp. OAct 916]
MKMPSFAVTGRKLLPLIGIIVVFGVIAVITTILGIPLLDRIMTIMFINLIMVLGLQMFMGNSGLLSFAHVGFMGIGAYASALFSIPVAAKAMSLPALYPALAGIEMGFFPAMMCGALIAAAFAAIVGYPLMRLSDTASAIASFALLVIVHVVLSQWSAITNGPRTLFGLLKYTDLWTAVTWALIILVVAFLFKESSLGMKLRASRDNVHAASAIGINVVRARWLAFTISAFVCGMSGALWAHFITSFQPGAFYMTQTFIVLTMLIVGGPRTVTGTAIGVLLVTIATEGLRAMENSFSVSGVLPFETVGMTEILLAILLIFMLAFRPGGLVQTIELGARRRVRAAAIDTSEAELSRKA